MEPQHSGRPTRHGKRPPTRQYRYSDINMTRTVAVSKGQTPLDRDSSASTYATNHGAPLTHRASAHAITPNASLPDVSGAERGRNMGQNRGHSAFYGGVDGSPSGEEVAVQSRFCGGAGDRDRTGMASLEVLNLYRYAGFVRVGTISGQHGPPGAGSGCVYSPNAAFMSGAPDALRSIGTPST